MTKKENTKMSVEMSQERVEQVEMLIRFFNMQAGRSCRVTNDENRKAVNNCIDRNRENIVGIKNYVRDYCKKNENASIVTCFDLCDLFVEEKKEELVVQPKQEVVLEKPEFAMAVLEKVIMQTIAQTQVGKIESQIMSGVEQKVKDFIKNEYGTLERKVVTVVDGNKVELGDGEVLHEQFDTICKFVANDEPVFLTGQAGTGKNVLCKQVAKALGLDFYFTNAVTQEYKITGFTDAMGVFHETQFYKAFKNGGLFMLDEMDASIPEVLIILNSAIANKYFDFPAPIGYVEAHPNFRVVSAGNTYGLGANYDYVGRNQLDMASLDRFALVKIGYCNAIEMKVANGNEELVKFCDDFREASIKAGVRCVISYRAIGRLAKMESLFDLKDAMRTCLTKSLEKDDLNAIKSCMSITSGKYFKALKEIIAND
jgi:hypothetical protein